MQGPLRQAGALTHDLLCRRAADSAGGGSSSAGGQKAGHVGVVIASVLFALMLLACLGARAGQ